MIAIFPEIAAASAKGDTELLAILVRKYFAGSSVHAPKIDMTSLLLSAGVDVQRLPLGAGTQAALLAKDERGAFNIVAVLKDGTGGVEPQSLAERFLLAHLLGHFLFDIQPLIARGDLQVSGYRESASPLRRYGQGGDARLSREAGQASAHEKEERADNFAAAVLLPLAMTKKAFTSLGQDIERTAHFFGVTKACLVRRLTQIGIFEAASLSFLDAEQTFSGAHASPSDAKDLDESQMLPFKASGVDKSTVPRAFAASTYGQTDKLTGRRPRGEAPPSTPSARNRTAANDGDLSKSELKESDAQKSKKEGKSNHVLRGEGMERIRQLARRLEKSQGEK